MRFVVAIYLAVGALEGFQIDDCTRGHVFGKST